MRGQVHMQCMEGYAGLDDNVTLGNVDLGEKSWSAFGSRLGGYKLKSREERGARTYLEDAIQLAHAY